MPFSRSTLGFETPFVKSAYDQTVEPSLSEEAGAAFRQQSFEYAAYDLITRQHQFQADPNFFVGDYVRTNYPDLRTDPRYYPLARAQSEAEFFALKQRIDKEQKDREILSRAGWSGVAWQVVAGTLSPTLLIPLVGVTAKGAYALRQGAALGALAIGIDETILQLAQESRPLEESAFAIGAGAVLGGVLGGAIGAVRANRAAYAAMVAKAEAEFTAAEIAEGVSVALPRTGQPSSVGAATAFEAPTGTVGLWGVTEGTFSKFGIGKFSLEQLGPVTRSLNQIFPHARFIAAQLSDAGLLLKGLKPGSVAARGGLVSELRKGWNAGLWKALRGYDEAWARYVFDAEPPRIATGARALVRSMTTPGILRKREFDLAVSRYMRGSENWTEGLDEKAMAAVKTAGDIMEKEVYTPIFENMKRIGLLPENVKTVGDLKYLNRIYDVQKILANPTKFLDILETHFKAKRARNLEVEIQKLNEQIIKAKVAEEDQTLPGQWAQARREVLKEQLKKLTETDPNTAAVLDELVNLRQLSRKAKKAGDESLVEQYLEEIKRLKEEHASALSTYRKARGTINERLKNLDRNIQLLEDKRSKKMAEIDRLLDQQSKTIERVARRYNKFVKELRKYSQPELEKEYNRLAELLDEAVKGYERAEARAQKLLDADNGDLAKTFTPSWKAFKSAEKMRKIQKQLEEARKTLDNSGQIQARLYKEWNDLVNAGRDLNNSRSEIVAKLREEVELLDPKIVRAALDKRKAELGLKRQTLQEKLRERGFDNVDFGDVEQQILDFTTNERLKEFYARWFQRDPKAVDVFTDVNRLSVVQPFTILGRRPGDVVSPGFHEALVKFKTGNDALKWMAENSSEPTYRAIAERLLGNADVEIIQVQPGDILPHGNWFPDSAAGFFFRVTDSTAGRPLNELAFIAIPQGPFVTESTLLHELIHAASRYQISKSTSLENSLISFRNSIMQEIGATNDIDIVGAIRNWITQNITDPGVNVKLLTTRLDYFLRGGKGLSANNIHELLTVGLTDKTVIDVLKKIKLPGNGKTPQTAWSWFVERLAKLFGLGAEEETALARLLELADETFDEQLPLEAVSKLSYFDPRRPTWVDAGARDIAEDVMNKIVGDPLYRLQTYDWLGSEQRGPELDRTLDVASMAVEDFLDNNPERLVRAYVRTVAPDMELFERFGSVNAAPQLAKLRDEYQAMLRAAKSPEARKEMIAQLEAKLAATTDEVEQKTLNFQLEALRAEMDPADIHKAYERAVEDIQAMIGRMRHTWGVPQNPAGWLARLAQGAMQVNTLRFMGMVLPSSVGDVGRLTAKYGLVRAYEKGLRPLVKQLKEFKVSAREGQLAGTALDVFLHTRMYEMMDLVEDGMARSKLEHALEAMTSKIGIVGLFDYWNTGMKMFSVVITNAEVLDSIQTVTDLAHRGAHTPKQAAEFLASLNIDSTSAEDIWRLVTAGGGGKSGDVWLPETEKWLEVASSIGIDQDRARFLQRLYRAALTREVDSTIVTTGLDRPLWMDRTLAGRLISQFKSFTMTSTFHVLMAGLQGKNANFAISAAISLAMGALSYKMWMVSVYGPNPDNHPDVDWEKWADEMIDRSGLLGVFAEVRNVGSTIPWIADAVTFSGAPPTRYGGIGTAGKLLGPSADLVETMARVLSGLEEPTEPWLRQVRKLLPYQNVWWARHTIFDPLVQAADLPEKRSARND